jgi:hypothetical protein
MFERSINSVPSQVATGVQLLVLAIAAHYNYDLPTPIPASAPTTVFSEVPSRHSCNVAMLQVSLNRYRRDRLEHECTSPKCSPTG